MILQAILLLPTVGGDALQDGPVTPRFEHLQGCIKSNMKC